MTRPVPLFSDSVIKKEPQTSPGTEIKQEFDVDFDPSVNQHSDVVATTPDLSAVREEYDRERRGHRGSP